MLLGRVCVSGWGLSCWVWSLLNCCLQAPQNGCLSVMNTWNDGEGGNTTPSVQAEVQQGVFNFSGVFEITQKHNSKRAAGFGSPLRCCTEPHLINEVLVNSTATFNRLIVHQSCDVGVWLCRPDKISMVRLTELLCCLWLFQWQRVSTIIKDSTWTQEMLLISAGNRWFLFDVLYAVVHLQRPLSPLFLCV